MKLASDLIKVAGAFAAFGYIELRAHVNSLGFSAGMSLGTERYLAELWTLIADALAPVITTGLLAALVITLVAGQRSRRTEGV